VFWGFMSLIATGVIVSIAMFLLSAVFVGVHQSVTRPNQTVAPATPKQLPLTAEETENAQAILKGLRRTRDEVTGTIWLEPSLAEIYDDQVYLYIGLTESKTPFLRLKIKRINKELLGVKTYIFRIDDAVETIESTTDLKTDYVVGNYWESFDELAEPHLQVIQKVAKGTKVLMRYDGRHGTEDRTVSACEKASLRQMVLVYRYLKKQAQSGL
jgi:hypothetical protein